jgi:hypothetical protein
MSPKLARIAEQVGVECFRIDLETAKAILLLMGEEVALAGGGGGDNCTAAM